MNIRGAFRTLFRTARPLVSSGRVKAADPLNEPGNWKKIGGSARDHSLDSWDQERMVADSRRSYQRDSIARRWIRMKTSFVVGNEPIATALAEDEATREKVQAALDAFQFDDVNKFPARIPKYVRNTYATGGLCLLLAGSEVEGATMTRVGRVDQEDINAAITDPDNADLRIGILRTARTAGEPQVVHPVTATDGSVHEMFAGKALGSSVEIQGAKVSSGASLTTQAVLGLPCMYVAINDMSGQQLGISDLFPALDALQDYDDVTHGGLQRAIAALAYAHMRRVPAGTSQKEIDGIADGIRESTSTGMGDVMVYTDDQAHEIQNPTLAGQDVAATADVPFRTICIAAGFPPHWLADPGSTNLATAGETAGPVVAMLAEDQATFGAMFGGVILYALRRVPELEALFVADPENLAFDLALPVLKSKDESRASQVFTADIAALAELKTQGLAEEAYQREATKRANDYGFELKPGDWRDPEEVAEEKSAFRDAFRSLDGRKDGEPEDGDETEMDEDGDEQGDAKAA